MDGVDHIVGDPSLPNLRHGENHGRIRRASRVRVCAANPKSVGSFSALWWEDSQGGLAGDDCHLLSGLPQMGESSLELAGEDDST